MSDQPGPGPGPSAYEVYQNRLAAGHLIPPPESIPGLLSKLWGIEVFPSVVEGRPAPQATEVRNRLIDWCATYLPRPVISRAIAMQINSAGILARMQDQPTPVLEYGPLHLYAMWRIEQGHPAQIATDARGSLADWCAIYVPQLVLMSALEVLDDPAAAAMLDQERDAMRLTNYPRPEEGGDAV